ncbi:cardiolipin synthase ClsB [Hydrogenophaga sp. IBVHS1]|uniref:cardiolipin synthase ClsB n=1 Tax=unclassified Hydrogenophaga TaxID=2610897 RepID=UPI000A2E7D8A|nr:cardiolipin synthase ClsB [Hydrogenophaga sp. IBVHS1]OSZ71481.1 cardiolipin synthase B [Hydrogenophaga sp. IBVHS1]
MNSHWLPGNRITLLENGEGYYPRVFEAISQARKEVLLETFILFDDKVGRELQQALLQAAARGATVHVLIDGWGSPDLPPSFTQPLLDAGVRLRAFEPARRLFGARINLLRRMHHKIVVVDGQHAFVGGINYSIDHLAEHGPLAKQDYAVEVEGPLVGQIQAFCRANVEAPQPTRQAWVKRWRAMRERAGEDREVEEGAVAAFVTRDNHLHRTDIERHYRAAIRSAQKRILIANAYFFPGYRLLRDLRRAAKRGVQVDLVMQGQPDMVWVMRATELLYRHLIRAGVRVHQYTERPLHAKVAVVDDRWATVGSSNLDPTSLSLNLEANVVVRDEAFACHLRERIEQLMEAHCKLVQRPVPGKLRSAWIGVRSFVVFHALRRFPVWMQRMTAPTPRVVPLQEAASSTPSANGEAAP